MSGRFCTVKSGDPQVLAPQTRSINHRELKENSMEEYYMNKESYIELFNEMHPGFFDPARTAHMPEDMIYEEQLLARDDAELAEITIPVPEGVTFGFYGSDLDTLHKVIATVDDSWPEYFRGDQRIYCAYMNGEIASFCLAEDMGTHPIDGISLRIGGPGCVGTVPKFRKQGIGLKMVQNVTRILFAEGYDISYIHYTGVGRWYEKLGYKTILRWKRSGII